MHLAPGCDTWRRSMVVALVGAVAGAVVPPAVAVASPPDAQPESPAPAEDDAAQVLAQAKALSEQGEEHYTLGHYHEAIALWEQAYQLLPATEPRAILLHKIANAHERAYALDDDIQHLRLALSLLEQYRGHIDVGDKESLAENDEKRKALAAKIEHEIDQAQRSPCADATEPAPPEPDPDPPPPIATAPAPTFDAAAARAWQRHRLQVGVGATVTALGVATTWGFVATLALGADVNRRFANTDDFTTLARLDQQGRRYNQAALATGIVAGALIVSGAALLIHARVHRPSDDGHRRSAFATDLAGLGARF